ncbi:T9SS type A sorting domain-containing protein [Aureisphaera galaxeae]|uniref:T9SS type A sorting domain-containing protein n=1 Tax=Aureisphaera galaxeae TaxID=1538023 RepID=UPI002350664B|nr:T9SS type A sorting domain-containing protein [Aureisphaera galaxeae]MDC8002651.1 T9SS type A sorting domain-containing protein [Aureisphaera galaxeae]
MKTKLLLSTLTFFMSLYMAAQYQTNVSVANEHYHDLNQTIINDGTDDIMVASNLFDPGMTNQVISLKRINQFGNVVWAREYDALPLVNARVFDIVNRFDLVYITGSVDVGGIKRVFIAEIDAATGGVLNSQFYDIVSPNFNSRGLHIEYTESDADGDGAPDPGLVVGGFFSDCYNLSTTCINNIGFVLRTDAGLNHIWAAELDALAPGASADYDFVNRITETSDGFFLTGSATGLNSSSFTQQGVLAHKIDFMGNPIWDNSYLFGNSQDVSVDAYYDAGTNEIYMLANYSVSHYFGVTVYNNTTGVINLTKSWYASSGDLDRYGFTIMESLSNPNNLVIAGYDRDENWTSGGTSFSGQSNVFVYEFDKASGNPVGINYQFLVPHTEPIGDEFNFWIGQMPLIYYPEMSFVHRNAVGTVSDYFHVGYRRNNTASFTAAELYKTDLTKRNICENLLLNIGPVGISTFTIQVSSGVIPAFTSPLGMNVNAYNYTEDLCDTGLSTGDQEIKTGVIYPNPVSNTLYTTITGATSYIIHDALGRKVAMGQLDASKAINVEGFTSGMYFISITDDSRSAQTFKFIKN